MSINTSSNSGSDLSADDLLRMAIAHGNVQALDQALANGANPALLTDNPYLPGSQPIYPAIISAAAYGDEDIIRGLLAAGADWNQVCANGMTADRALQEGLNPSLTDRIHQIIANPRHLSEQLHEQKDNHNGLQKSPFRTWEPPRPRPSWAD